jgi:hypothetical protein
MIEFGGIYYYIDLDTLEKIITIQPEEGEYHTSIETTTKTFVDGTIETTTVQASLPKMKELDAAKYDIIRNCIDIILDSDDQGDSALGAESALEQMPMAYKVAFNTLYKYEIIKEQD